MQHKQNRGCTSMPSFYHTHILWIGEDDSTSVCICDESLACLHYGWKGIINVIKP